MVAAGVGGNLPDSAERLADVRTAISRAVKGGLVQTPNYLKPVAQDPYLWELKFKWSGQKFRLYYGEPTMDETLIVGLHFHPKVTRGLTTDRVKAAQNREIQLAIGRFWQGESRGWSSDYLLDN